MGQRLSTGCTLEYEDQLPPPVFVHGRQPHSVLFSFLEGLTMMANLSWKMEKRPRGMVAARSGCGWLPTFLHIQDVA